MSFKTINFQPIYSKTKSKLTLNVMARKEENENLNFLIDKGLAPILNHQSIADRNSTEKCVEFSLAT